jgi:hypothetical protein
MKYISLLFLLFILPVAVFCQEGDKGYVFLRFPAVSRISALGGYSVSMAEVEPALAFHNPALLGGEMDMTLNVNYMNYMSDVNVGNAIFTKAFRTQSSWGIGGTYVNYGSMKEMTANDEYLGVFTIQDIGLYGFYAYDLSDRWRGGLSLKMLYSSLADYSSFGLAVDAGLSYFVAETDFSFGFALKNIGAQLKSYHNDRQEIPWDIQMGFTQRLAHAPLRISVTGIYLNKWKLNYVDDTIEKSDHFFKTLMKHLVFGVEFLPTRNFWLGIGLNPKTMMDMRLNEGNGLRGFSIGGGVKVSRFNVGASVAQYHPSATSVMVSVVVVLSQSKP